MAENLGVQATVSPADPAAAQYASAIEVGLRLNQSRAQLLVSRVLGKHIPVPVADVLAAAHCLGARARHACAERTPIVIGFAETATALGHGVAAVSGAGGGSAPYLHTTRRRDRPGEHCIEFREEHSHAAQHTLAVLDDAILRQDRPLVLADDELSTGNTARNAIRALQQKWPRRQYVLASLLDSRTAAQRAGLAAAVQDLGAEVISVTLANGRIRIPADILGRAQRLRRQLPPALCPAGAPVPVTFAHLTLPAELAAAAHGWGPAQERAARQAMSRAAAGLPVAADGRTLILGDEEFMYLPQLVAAALGAAVRTSATTRSPVAAVDAPGYPLRTVLSFPATEDGQRPAYAYNVAPSGCDDRGNAPGFDDIVLCTDTRHPEHVTRLAAQLARCARRSVHVLTTSC